MTTVFTDQQYRWLENNYNVFERWFNRSMSRGNKTLCQLSIRPKYRPTPQEMETNYLTMERHVRTVLRNGCWCRQFGFPLPTYNVDRCVLYVPNKQWAIRADQGWREEEVNWERIERWVRYATANCRCEDQPT